MQIGRSVSEFLQSRGWRERAGVLLCMPGASVFKDHARSMANYPFYFATPEPAKRKIERKPYPTPMKVLISRAKESKKFTKANPCRMLEDPPDNGLLVPELIEVANEVYQAWKSLLLGLSHIIRFIPVKRCRFCSEIHIGHIGHEIMTCAGRDSYLRNGLHVWKDGQVHDVVFSPYCFHLSDRVGKPRVGDCDLTDVHRLPSIVELCIQAGLELDNYPTRRRTNPVYSVDGNIADFEPKFDKKSNTSYGHNLPKKPESGSESAIEFGKYKRVRDLVDGMLRISKGEEEEEEGGSFLKELGVTVLSSWEALLRGCRRLMEKYKVHTCGYCPEVQVGPKGHRVTECRAHKFWSRDGMHAWQEATAGDVIPCNYVWHVRDSHGPPLANGVKRYYRKAPAVVELCVQAGAPLGEVYQSMLLQDVVIPDRDEVDIVA